MGKFNPTSLTKEVLDKAVSIGKLSDYYIDGDTLVKEIARKDGGYVLKMIVNANNAKEHVMATYVYDNNGRLIDTHIHR